MSSEVERVSTAIMATPSFVIASDRPWNRRMPGRLSERTGLRFELIDNPQGLTAERLSLLQPTHVFFPHWSSKIPKAIFQRYNCIIFHMTDLPFGRGGSPLQNLISSGLSETVISAIQCEEEIDSGAIYLKRPLSLYGNAEEIYIRASEIIEDMILDIIFESPQSVPQTGDPTYFKRRRPEQGDISGLHSLTNLFNHIRMLDAEGYPPAFADIGPYRIEFTRAARRVGAIHADVRIVLRSEDDR